MGIGGIKKKNILRRKKEVETNVEHYFKMLSVKWF